MAKTLNQLVYSVKEIVSAFFITDDFQITDTWLADQLISQNHTLLRKAYTQRRLDEMLYLWDSKLQLKVLDSSFLFEGVTIKNKTDFCYADLKPLVTGLRGREIDVVANVGLSKVFTRTTLRRLLRAPGRYYVLPGKGKYAISGDKLLFRVNEAMSSKFISVNAIWSDPRKVNGWNNDMVFPTPSEKNLELLTIEHIGRGMGFPADLINDATRAYVQRQPAQEEKK